MLHAEKWEGLVYMQYHVCDGVEMVRDLIVHARTLKQLYMIVHTSVYIVQMYLGD